MTVVLQANERQAVVIPEEALLPAGRRNFVMLLEQGPYGPLARQVAVTTGARRAGEVEILDGVQAGQSVITHGALNAADGEPVTIQAAKTGD